MTVERPGASPAIAAADDQHPRLAPDEVHVWSASLLRDPRSHDALLALLDAEERARAARFHHEAHRRRWIAGRGILRALLGRYLAVAPAQIALVYGEYGKPALAAAGGGGAPHPLRFNLAHADDVALYAFALGREVGVDVEPVRATPDAEAIAARFFSAREADQLRALPPAARGRAFVAGWTRKEAYLKGRGSGLARPLSDFTVSLAPGPAVVPLLDADGGAEEWVLHALEPAAGDDDGYVGALAVERGRGVAVRRLRWR